MKYKPLDRVRIKSLDWYNENKDEDDNVVCLYSYFDKGMSEFCDKIVTIKSLHGCHNVKAFRIIEDDGYSWWSDDMIEGLVEEETALNKWTGLKVELELSKSVIGVSNVESLRGERFMSGFVKAIIPPEGYQFVDENGNVINAQKIVLEKKKEYPKTYEECLKIMGVKLSDCYIQGYKSPLLEDLQELLICRDAYWKIAGEEMGLGKPWEPDWTSTKYKYCITTRKNKVEPLFEMNVGFIFAFPTEEMRDAFYENFKELIEAVKELL